MRREYRLASGVKIVTGKENIKQRIKGGERTICPQCFHWPVCSAIVNQPCVECSHYVPATDVVEVVRCRDCKHYDCEDGDQKCVKDAEWDEEGACYYGFISYHGPEFYCADGERR